MSAFCPACHANDTEAVDSVDRADLIHSYRQKGIEVGAYLHGDHITLGHCNRCELGFFDPAYVGDSFFYEQLHTPERQTGILPCGEADSPK